MMRSQFSMVVLVLSLGLAIEAKSQSSVSDVERIADKASEVCGGKGGELKVERVQGHADAGVRWRLLGAAGVGGDVLLTDEQWRNIQRVRSEDRLADNRDIRECTQMMTIKLLESVSPPQNREASKPISQSAGVLPRKFRLEVGESSTLLGNVSVYLDEVSEHKLYRFPLAKVEVAVPKRRPYYATLQDADLRNSMKFPYDGHEYELRVRNVSLEREVADFTLRVVK